jgi:TPR repeat protein
MRERREFRNIPMIGSGPRSKFLRLVLVLGLAIAAAPAMPSPAAPQSGLDTAQRQSQLTRICDLLAASPYDRQRPADIPGVAPEKLDVAAAKPACQAAVGASPGNPRLLFELGRALTTGKEDTEARTLYEKAAAQGYAAAQTSLGVFYASGRGGLAKNDEEAARLYKLAADQGFAAAQNRLGVFYELGYGGLAKNDQEAARLYKLAADQGLAEAQANLGRFYELRHGGLAR